MSRGGARPSDGRTAGPRAAILSASLSASLGALAAACGAPDASAPASDDGAASGSGSGSDDAAPTSASTLAGSDETGGPSSGDTGPSASGPLVDLAAWVPVPADADPWAAERPADAVCDAGHVYEDLVFEVDTEICTFGTFVQPSLLPVRAGDEIELILLHDNLYSADGDAEAHVAVGLGGAPIWETAIPIPMLQSLVRPTFVAPADAPAGTPVHFHVHNHGYNNYRMIGLALL